MYYRSFHSISYPKLLFVSNIFAQPLWRKNKLIGRYINSINRNVLQNIEQICFDYGIQKNSWSKHKLSKKIKFKNILVPRLPSIFVLDLCDHRLATGIGKSFKHSCPKLVTKVRAEDELDGADFTDQLSAFAFSFFTWLLNKNSTWMQWVPIFSR